MSTEGRQTNTREAELGALWLRRQGDGTPYFTGSVSLDGGATKVKVVIFKNKKKANENQPDYRVLRSQPRPESAPAAQADPFGAAPTQRPAQDDWTRDVPSDNDIPF